ncbi:hypothetical protein GUJ93_ZPchr0005g14386 [Zizania palustris]|uniref:C3H1-type domain-containing protein n=1 Tax=Zizania palustris TaxID=103762 RepID=A0A8J5VRQ2_ZIZPA|nr:hypothetical protein GUJ93_ZPchr0005g14386 [Zizania palustris]
MAFWTHSGSLGCQQHVVFWRQAVGCDTVVFWSFSVKGDISFCAWKRRSLACRSKTDNRVVSWRDEAREARAALAAVLAAEAKKPVQLGRRGKRRRGGAGWLGMAAETEADDTDRQNLPSVLGFSHATATIAMDNHNATGAGETQFQDVLLQPVDALEDQVPPGASDPHPPSSPVAAATAANAGDGGGAAGLGRGRLGSMSLSHTISAVGLALLLHHPCEPAPTVNHGDASCAPPIIDSSPASISPIISGFEEQDDDQTPEKCEASVPETCAEWPHLMEQGADTEPGATVTSAAAQGHMLVEQDITGQPKLIDEDLPVVKEVLFADNNLHVEDWEKPVRQGAVDDERSTNRSVAALEHQAETVEHCHEPITPMDGNVLENQEIVDQQVTVDSHGAVKDENIVEFQVTEKVEQYVIEERGEITEDTAVEDQEKALDQCAGDQSEVTKDENAEIGKDKIVDQEGSLHKQGTTKDGNVVEYQGEVEQDAIDKQSAIKYDIVEGDQRVVVKACPNDESKAAMHDNFVGKQEVMGQDIIEERGQSTDDIATEDHEKAVEFTNDELRGTMDGYAMEYLGVVKDDVISRRGETTDNITVDNQVKEVDHDVICERSETSDGIAVKDQEHMMEHFTSNESRAIENDNSIEDQELVGPSVFDELGETTGGIAFEDQRKVLQECVSDELGATKNNNTVDGPSMLKQGVTHKIGETMDDIAVDGQEMTVEQYTSAELGGTESDSALEYQVAEHLAMYCFAAEDLDKVVEQRVGDVSRDTMGKDAMGKKVVEQDAIGKEGAMCMDDIAMKDEKGNMLEQSIGDEQGATKGKLAVQKNMKVVDHVLDWAVVKEKVKLCVRYPQRPGKPNCPFYISTGSCSYGLSCNFNHPLLKPKPDVSSLPSEQGNHGVAEILELNCVGLPIREGARNCNFYMSNGTCRYGKKCHFNHPEQVIDAQFDPPTRWENDALPSLQLLKKSCEHANLDDISCMKSSDHSTLDDTSYSKRSFNHVASDEKSSVLEVLPPNILQMLLPPEKVPLSTEAKVVKVNKDPNWSAASDDFAGCCSADCLGGLLCKQEHVHYPERPGRPECPFYMRFGDCKFGSACKYHHSKDRFPSRYHSKYPLQGEDQVEYPERPGEPECPFYMKNGFCKFGVECKFHHPKGPTPSWWSPTNIKKPAAANEHPATRITLQDHLYLQDQYSERPGQPNCRYYMQFGKCKYLPACMFHHPKDRLSSGSHPSETVVKQEEQREQARFPERPGEPECFYYMKHGSCKFQRNCKYHHPKDRPSKKSYDLTFD